MARYAKVDLGIAPREESMLVKTVRTLEAGYILGTYDQIAPGLYPGEETYRLDTGDELALVVETLWLENGEGISFHGRARAIEADGSSRLTDKDQTIGSAFTLTVPASLCIKHGVDALATDAALIILGEEPLIMEMVPMPPGHDPDVIPVPVVNLSPEVKANASIRDQLSLVEQVKEFPKLSL